MPINHELKLCFIHIPKTGGSTIESMIPDIFPNQNIGILPWENQTADYNHLFGQNLQHLSFKQIINLIPHILKDNYFIFTMVRNPYERVVSMIGWYNKRWIRKREISQSEFNSYISGLEDRWINDELRLHEIQQHRFLDDDLSQIDYILKLEDFNENKLKELEKAIVFKNHFIHFNFNYQPNKILMKSSHKHYLEYFKNNKKALSLINKIYYLDFKKFNYPFLTENQ